MKEYSNKKIRLVVAVNDFRIGGAQKLVSDLLVRFDRNYFELHLITLTQLEGHETFYDVVPSDVTVYKLQFGGFLRVGSWIALYRLLRTIKPHVVWSNLFFSNTVFRTLKPFVGYKVVIAEHNTYQWKTLFQRGVDSALARVTHTIIAVSENVKEYTSKHEWIPKKKFTVICNGIDTKKFQKPVDKETIAGLKKEFGFSPEDKIIISVGQFIRQKNQALLIEAFASFRKKNNGYKLVILGDGSLRSELESQIASFGLKDDIKLPGIRKNPEIFYAMSDFFVLTSKYEGFGIVCIEAMASGIPVIATRVAGPNEYIEEGMNGLLVDGSVDDIAKKIDILANMTSKEKEQYRTHTIDTARQYDIVAVTKKYEQIFLRAM